MVFVSSNTRKPRFKPAEKEFLLGELIGKRVRVAFASEKSLLGLEGLIADETLNTFVLHTGKGTKRVPKTSCTFAFPDAGLLVEGRLLMHRPEDRTKRLYNRI